MVASFYLVAFRVLLLYCKDLFGRAFGPFNDPFVFVEMLALESML
jgi:hypothetical protein